jgi:hypothetical protein
LPIHSSFSRLKIPAKRSQRIKVELSRQFDDAHGVGGMGFSEVCSEHRAAPAGRRLLLTVNPVRLLKIALRV